MYHLEISPQALTFLERLRKTHRPISDRLVAAIDHLRSDPFKGKKLLGELFDLRSLRVGEYRVLYAILQEKILIRVVKIGHRREIYR